jgi:hypothetical protein
MQDQVHELDHRRVVGGLLESTTFGEVLGQLDVGLDLAEHVLVARGPSGRSSARWPP